MVLDALRGLENQCLKARIDGGRELEAQSPCPLDGLQRIGKIRRRALPRHLGLGVTEHALGARAEDLDDAAFVGGDARNARAVQNGVLQCARAARVAPAAVLDNDVRHMGAPSHAPIRSAVRWSA